MFACSSFEPADANANPDGGVVGSDAAPDAELDAAGSDGAPSGDAATDVKIPSTICSGPLVVGSDDLTSATDFDDVTTLDAYGYRFKHDVAAEVRCVHVWIENFTATGVRVGIYGNDGSDQPAALLATATFSKPKIGWNDEALNLPLQLQVGSKVWIAVIPVGQTMKIRQKSSCSGELTLTVNTGIASNTALPNPFGGNLFEPTRCGAAFYLSL